MFIPPQIIVNADDLGLTASVNKAILYCFEQGYINSTSLLTNMGHFNDAVDIIHKNPIITNIGIHINFAEGPPLTNFTQREYIDDRGNWNIEKTGNLFNKLNTATKNAFSAEINAQIEKALSEKIKIVHLDSHLHLHTLPAFYDIFIKAAKTHQLKIRLAQTYREGSYLKFYYRKYINNCFKKANINYSDLFENVNEFLKNKARRPSTNIIEIMVHPDFNTAGELIDSIEPIAIKSLTTYFNNGNTLNLR